MMNDSFFDRYSFGQTVPIPPDIHKQIRVLRFEPENHLHQGLAVWVVSRYLERFAYTADFWQSTAWNPLLRILTPSSDLEVFDVNTSLGFLQISPIDGQIQMNPFHPDPIAYVWVDFTPSLSWGAIAAVSPDSIFPSPSTDAPFLLLDLLQNFS